jgi:hypothetical protein
MQMLVLQRGENTAKNLTGRILTIQDNRHKSFS